jgi:hypothetical protein
MSSVTVTPSFPYFLTQSAIQEGFEVPDAAAAALAHEHAHEHEHEEEETF